MSSYPKQVEFLKLVQRRIPAHLNPVDTLGELLQIGSDSTYRRLRGETALSFEEAQKISQTFGISMDSASIDNLHRVDFDAGTPILSAQDYAGYAQRLVDRMLQFPLDSQEVHMYYLAQDFPLFYIYRFPAMARLKSYYWGRSILGLPEFSQMPYSAFRIPEERLKMGSEVVRAYAAMPSSEVWTNSSYLSTLKQLQYCWETGIIQDVNDALAILKEMEELLDLMLVQSEAGQKCNLLTGQPTGGPFQWYITDLSVGNNAVYVDTPGGRHSFLSFNTFNFIETTHPGFNAQTDLWLKQLLKKSTLVTAGSQAIRDTYVHKLRRQIHSIRDVIVHQEDTLL